MVNGRSWGAWLPVVTSDQIDVYAVSPSERGYVAPRQVWKFRFC
jgi:hypothetical protein